LHAILVAAPDRILVLYREDAFEAALVEGVNEARPVDLAEPGHPVAPPARVPAVGSLHGLSEHAVAVAPVGEQLGVLRMGVRDAVDVRPKRGDRVDPEP